MKTSHGERRYAEQLAKQSNKFYKHERNLKYISGGKKSANFVQISPELANLILEKNAEIERKRFARKEFNKMSDNEKVNYLMLRMGYDVVFENVIVKR